MNNEQLNEQLKKLENELNISSVNTEIREKLSLYFSYFNLPLGGRDPEVKDIEHFQIYFIGLVDAFKNKKIDLYQYVDYRYRLLTIFNKKIILSQQAVPAMFLNLENNFDSKDHIKENKELIEIYSQLKALYEELYNKDFMDKEYLDREINLWSSVHY